MAKQKIKEMKEKKCDCKGGGVLFIPAGLFVGMGIGFFTNLVAGMFIGLGAGFAFFALFKKRTCGK